MIDIKDKALCCGCSACAQSCPCQCIRMVVDKEGFFYPQVDEFSCINCGLCNKVCPFENPYDSVIPVSTIAYKHSNDVIREHSLIKVGLCLEQDLQKIGKWKFLMQKR